MANQTPERNHKIITGRIIVLVAFIVEFILAGCSQLLGGNKLLGGWFPMHYVYQMLMYVITVVVYLYYRKHFYHDDLFPTEEYSQYDVVEKD